MLQIAALGLGQRITLGGVVIGRLTDLPATGVRQVCDEIAERGESRFSMRTVIVWGGSAHQFTIESDGGVWVGERLCGFLNPVSAAKLAGMFPQ